MENKIEKRGRPKNSNIRASLCMPKDFHSLAVAVGGGSLTYGIVSIWNSVKESSQIKQIAKAHKVDNNNEIN